ncbi:MAG: dihydroneopterin aldolase [Dysgonomonas sp.]
MESYILLENVKFYARHGVSDQETTVGNSFIINLKINVDISAASVSDNLEDTLNYASVYEVVKKEMDIPSKLLEHVGGRILQSLKKNFPNIKTIELKISKQNPPIRGQVEYASVILID